MDTILSELLSTNQLKLQTELKNSIDSQNIKIRAEYEYRLETLQHKLDNSRTKNDVYQKRLILNHRHRITENQLRAIFSYWSRLVSRSKDREIKRLNELLAQRKVFTSWHKHIHSQSVAEACEKASLLQQDHESFRVQANTALTALQNEVNALRAKLTEQGAQRKRMENTLASVLLESKLEKQADNNDHHFKHNDNVYNKSQQQRGGGVQSSRPLPALWPSSVLTQLNVRH